MQINDFMGAHARESENVSNICQTKKMPQSRAEYRPGEFPKLKLSQILSKPIVFPDGGLLPVVGVTVAGGGKIRHFIVKMGEAAEIYLPFGAARISAWRIVPDNVRPCSPKGTQRLTIGKPVYSTNGLYCGKLTDILLKNGILSLFYTENGVFSAENLYAAGDALLLRPSDPYPIGQKIPVNTRAETYGGVPVRLSKQVTKAALKYFLHEGKLIEFTTSLPLFCRK